MYSNKQNYKNVLFVLVSFLYQSNLEKNNIS